LTDLADQFRSQGIRSSIFVDTNLENIEYAAKSGVDRIELYTGPFAEDFSSNPDTAIKEYVAAANLASELGLGINAGHDLSLDNLRFFDEHITGLMEVSIGHALISDALYYGLENTIQMYKRLLR
jgi:pyridoxine 5-phosphate synthase